MGSSLCQIPMIWQMIGHSGVIGVITGHSGLLRRAISAIPAGGRRWSWQTQGMENQPLF